VRGVFQGNKHVPEYQQQQPAAANDLRFSECQVRGHALRPRNFAVMHQAGQLSGSLNQSSSHPEKLES
jgi:hypothetical protein